MFADGIFWKDNGTVYYGDYEYAFEGIRDKMWFEKIVTGGTRRTAQLYMNPCKDFPPSFYKYSRRRYSKPNRFDFSKFELREAAVFCDNLYEMSGKIYNGNKVVCLTRPGLIKEHENHRRFLRLSASLGKSSYFNQIFMLSYEDYTTKTDTAVYCAPYKYSVPGFYEETDNTSSALFPYNVYKSLRLLVRINEPVYCGTSFDFKEYEFERVRSYNYCKGIKL